MIGRTFGRLTVLAVQYGRHGAIALCRCACGTEKSVQAGKLETGHTRSCGCLQRELIAERQKTHGHYYEPEFQAWKNMKARCADSPYYARIEVCPEWAEDYEAFKAHVGPRPSPRHSIDRVRNEQGYIPGNVRWATKAVQSQNTRNHVTNKTGERGVSFSRSKGRYRAHISVNGKSKHLGYFDSVPEAAAARAKAERELWSEEQ